MAEHNADFSQPAKEKFDETGPFMIGTSPSKPSGSAI
jgi:hypothetical protein